MSIRLMVLGLLNQSSKTGYEIQKWIETSRAEAWADVQTGSIYHALRQMEKEELLQIQERIQTGHRSKAVYAITDSGRSEFRRLLRESLQHPPHAFPTEFYTTLVFLDELPRTEILAALDALILKVRQEIETWTSGESIKQEILVLPPHIRAIFLNGREHLETDLKLLIHLHEIFS